MTQIRQYRPAFVTGFENETVEFDGVDALRAIEFVANFASIPHFHRFSVGVRDYGEQRRVLMAEYHGGAEWWVVGFLDCMVDLPVWDYAIAGPLKAAREALQS